MPVSKTGGVEQSHAREPCRNASYQSGLGRGELGDHHSALFGDHTPMRSPRLSPSAKRPAANASPCSTTTANSRSLAASGKFKNAFNILPRVKSQCLPREVAGLPACASLQRLARATLYRRTASLNLESEDAYTTSIFQLTYPGAFE